MTAQVQQLLGPLEKSLTDEYTRTVKAGGGAISGYTNQLAHALGGYSQSAGNIYGGAEQSQAAADAAFSGALTGGGQGLADQLSAKLAQIDAPGNTPQQVAQTGQGAGNALLGTGTADLSRLIAQGAAAQDYGAKLPGIARQQGLSDIKDLTLASNKTLADQMGQVRGQIPGLVQNIEGSQAKQASEQQKERVALLIAQGRYQEAEQVANQNNQTRLTIADQTNATRASEADVRHAQSDRSFRLAWSKAHGYDPVTNQTLPGYKRDASGNVVKTAAGAGANGVKPPTAGQIAGFVQAWKSGKPTSVTTPVVDPKTGQPKVNPTTGKPITTTQSQAYGRLTFAQAYKRLTALGVTDQQARKALDSAYQRGEQGRGWLTNEEQAALAQARLEPRAHRYKGHAYLDRQQAAALNAARKLPPGQWVEGRTNVKDLGQIYVISEVY